MRPDMFDHIYISHDTHIGKNTKKNWMPFEQIKLGGMYMGIPFFRVLGHMIEEHLLERLGN
jgi:hypothetical protein